MIKKYSNYLLLIIFNLFFINLCPSAVDLMIVHLQNVTNTLNLKFMIKGNYVRSFAGGVFKKGEKTNSPVELKTDLNMQPGAWFVIESFDPKEEELSYELKGKWIKFPSSVINYIEKQLKEKNQGPIEIVLNTALYKRIPWLKSYDIFIFKEREKKFLIGSAIFAAIGLGFAGAMLYYGKKRREKWERQWQEQQKQWEEKREKAEAEWAEQQRKFEEWFSNLSPEEQEKWKEEHKRRRFGMGSGFHGFRYEGGLRFSIPEAKKKAREVLGVSADATKEQIRKAWLKKAARYHSDKFEVYKEELMKEFHAKTEAEAREKADEKFKEFGNAKDLLE